MYLNDMRNLEKRFGFDDTYSYSNEMLIDEMFVVIVQETALSSTFSLIAIFIVVLLITGSVRISGVTVISVLLVDLFLIALIPLTNLTFNNLIVVHLIASLGLSVLYSAHISHTFLLVEAPMEFDQRDERLWKTKVALSRMGSSVLHGSIATLIAVIIVGV